MAVPALCQAGLFCAELYLNSESEKIAIIENNELEANAIVLNLVSYSDNGWGIIFDESMRGSAIRRDEFQHNQKSLRNLLQELKNLPVQNDLTKEIYSYATVVVDVLGSSESNVEDRQPDQGEVFGLVNRLATVRKTASKYLTNFAHLLNSLNKQRAEIHSVRLQKERQRRIVQQFLLISLVLDALLVLTLPVIFLRDITSRLKLLLANAEKLPTNEPLLQEIGGQDEITFLNTALCNASERLKEVEQSKQLLTDMLAHDIRSPLTSAELLMSDVSSQSAEYSEQVAQKMTRLHMIFKQIKRLVEDMLSIERLESGEFELNINFFDLIELVQLSLQTIEPQVTLKGLIIDLKITESVLEVAADRERILQVLDNLLSNAVKHSPLNGTVRVTLSKSSSAISVSISDQGPGVPKNKEKLVFERQFQTDEGRSRGGFGLGLTIAKQIIKKHGGTISLANVRPHGCLVTFSLPVDEDV